MGYMRQHAIVVTSCASGLIDAAHAKAEEIFPWVSQISPEVTNGFRSFFVPPDGSKEGWTESDYGDARRDEFVAWLDSQRHGDGSTSLWWVEATIGDEDGRDIIVRGCRRSPKWNAKAPR